MGNTTSKSDSSLPPPPTPPLISLTETDIANYFSNLGGGYSSYSTAILDNQIDGKFLATILKTSDEEIKECLMELGITSKIHQNRLLTILRDLQKEATLNTETVFNFTKVEESLPTSAKSSPPTAAPPAKIHKLFISLRFAESKNDAEILQGALEARGISTFLCAVDPGGDITVEEVVQALHNCQLAIIMGTRSYGKDTGAGFSTFEELRYIHEEGKPFFLIKMCERFEEPETIFRLGESISWIEWTPGSPMPRDLVLKIEQRLASVSHQTNITIPVQPVAVGEEKKDPSEESPTKMGYKYWRGEGVVKDKNMAERLWREEAKKGDKEAFYALVFRNLEGKGNQKLKEECFEWNLKESKNGNVEAIFTVGRCYHIGDGVAQNLTKAVEVYMKAAELGHATAINNLGVCYANGEGVVQNKTKAVDFYTKAAELGDATGMTNLGVCYYNGDGIVKDISLARHWWTLAANKGDTKAKENLRKFSR